MNRQESDKPADWSVFEQHRQEQVATMSRLSVQASSFPLLRTPQLTARTGMLQYAWLPDKLAAQCVFEFITQGKVKSEMVFLCSAKAAQGKARLRKAGSGSRP